MTPWTQRLASVALVLSSACSTPAPGPAPAGESVGVVSTEAPRAIDGVALRAQLAEHRAQQIAHLDAYAQAGQFPHNVTTAPSLHMFRDPEGRLCAVANLILTDGRGDLVEATVLAQNDLAIADVHGGAMMDWVQRSGLTQEELVRIQAPAPFIGQRMTPPVARPAINVAVKAPSAEEQMNAAIARHVAQVEAELRANTEKSLDVAVARYVGGHGAGV